jgi:flavin-dependent dehydrogenase
MVAIVGGGPAGCSAGIFLAKEGFENITIYEKSPNKRKACGGGLSWRVLNRYKEFVKGIDNYPVKKCLFDFDGSVFNFTFKRRIGTIVDRLEFDKNMRYLAESYGAKIISKNIELNKIKNDLIVDASGFRRSKNVFMCIQSFAKMKNPEFSFIFRKGINPAGYLWIFPLSDNYANVGLGGWSKTFKLPINEAFNKFLKELKLNVKNKYASLIGIYCDFDELGEISGKRTILRAGEAANLVNPVTGEGIYYALRSGEIVATSMLKINPVNFYKKSIENEFGKDFLFSKILYNILVKSPSIIEKNVILMLLKLLNHKI